MTTNRHRSRRAWSRPPIVALPMIVVLLATACGGDDDDSTAEASPPASSSDGGAAEGGDDGGLPPQPLPEPTTLRITIPAKYETFASVYVGDALGEFEKENLTVELIDAPSTDAIPLLERDEIQVQGCGPAVGIYNAIQAGVDMVWAAPNSTPSGPGDQTGFWVSNDLLDSNGDVDPDKLQAATVGLGNLQLGSSNALPVAEYLDSIGLELTDLETSTLNGGDLVAAFQNGAVQAAWFNAPLWQPIDESGEATLVHPQGDLVLGGYCVGPGRDSEPERIEAFMRAIARTNRLYLQGDYHENDEVVEVISDAIGIEPDVIRSTPPLVFDPDLNVDEAIATDLQEIWLDAGLLSYEAPLSADDIVDQSLVESGLAG